MWGYEYEEQKKKKRRKAILSLIPTLIVVGLVAWGISIYFSISLDERQLFSAAESGEVGEIYEALDAGADPNVQKRNGQTPLHVAAWHDQTAVARALISAGADPNIRDESAGETPLHTAVRANNPEMVILLMSGGARTSLRTFAESEPDVRGNVHLPGSTPYQMAEASDFREVTRIFRGG
ncbi:MULTISPECIES: ankyrin repeat domain-containing protein [unclassified Wenzhouxiangella]|uniref:ankyrin repeat domain-containing protein n=1 Tax=unclassified Wenzhouxiangella TaxID=2613841 RepID=UPI0015F256C1|nr:MULTISPECIES: ankyrin repeat domain-containing protein [unclassified Wenzhouxiangella]